MLCNVYTSIAGEYDVFASLLTSPSSMKKMTKKIEITGIFHRTHRSTIRQFHIINYPLTKIDFFVIDLGDVMWTHLASS